MRCGNHRPLVAAPIHPAAGGAEGPRGGLGGGGKHALGLEDVAHRADDVVDQPLPVSGPRQRRLALTVEADVATYAARPQPFPARRVIQGRGRRQQTGLASVGTPHPDLDALDRLPGAKRRRRAQGGRLVQKVLRIPADELACGVAQKALGRDEREAPVGPHLPGEIAGDLDQFLVALPRFDERGAQVDLEGPVLAQHQDPVIGKRKQGQFRLDLAAVMADIERLHPRAPFHGHTPDQRRDPGRRIACDRVDQLGGLRVGAQDLAIAGGQECGAGKRAHDLAAENQPSAAIRSHDGRAALVRTRSQRHPPIRTNPCPPPAPVPGSALATMLLHA